MRVASLSTAAADSIDEMKRLALDESGASLIEYALVVALVGAVCVAGLSALGTHAKDSLSSAAAYLP
jgi:Flp pilus assembly pilin Flp